MSRRTRTCLAALLALSALGSSCSMLKDPEPFTAEVVYSEGVGGGVTVSPIVVQGDASFGEISIRNDTREKHGFAIRELSVFEEVPPSRTIIVTVAEAKDDHTYVFECQIHDDPPEFRGEIAIDYVAEEERR